MSDIITFNTEDAATGKGYVEKPKTFKLVSENDPILKEIVTDFDFGNSTVNANEFASSLVETCREHNGFGLAANQCGFKHRVFVMGSGDEFVAFFNPKIISRSEDETILTEGCLSFPMLAVKISRPNTIDVTYQDFNGIEHSATFSGLSSHIFQHELDHLNGIVYTERAKPMALKMGLKKKTKFNKLMNRYNLAQKVLKQTN
jgi:peptide deformylase